jgi:hypothetical protein
MTDLKKSHTKKLCQTSQSGSRNVGFQYTGVEENLEAAGNTEDGLFSILVFIKNRLYFCALRETKFKKSDIIQDFHERVAGR